MRIDKKTAIRKLIRHGFEVRDHEIILPARKIISVRLWLLIDYLVKYHSYIIEDKDGMFIY